MQAGTRWRTKPAGQVAILGALIAVGAAFAPALAPLVVLAALAWVVGSLLVGAREVGWRLLLAALEAVGVALVLAAPWVVGTALAGKGSVAIFGLPLAGATAPDWGEIIRFAVGPVARSPLVWLLVAAAALPLALGRGIRLLWAARLWVTACASWGLALAAVRGDMGSFAPSLPVVLAPAALAVAACLGVGISSSRTISPAASSAGASWSARWPSSSSQSDCSPWSPGPSVAGGTYRPRGSNSRFPFSTIPARPMWRGSCGSAIREHCRSGGGRSNLVSRTR